MFCGTEEEQFPAGEGTMVRLNREGNSALCSLVCRRTVCVSSTLGGFLSTIQWFFETETFTESGTL